MTPNEDKVIFDNVINDLDKPKTLDEYMYMLDHFYIYTHDELRIILSAITKEHEYYSELEDLYNEASEFLKKNG
jgi:hypothetical protein